MRVSSVYVRFYRAFNFDYLRKHHPNAVPRPWDTHEGLFYPYLRVDLDNAITCVVGANEVGKSQLLTAIEIALGAESARAADFCRYSRFFTVGGELRLPHFGVTLSDLTQQETDRLAEVTGREFEAPLTEMHLFRQNAEKIQLFVGNEIEPQEVDAVELPDGLLPKTFRIDTKVPIPDSVPIDYLARRGDGSVDNVLAREDRWNLIDPMVKNFQAIRDAIGKNNASALGKLLPTAESSSGNDAKRRAGFELAFELIVTVGGVDASVFRDLEQALRAENEGFANGLVATINRKLSESLNLSHWWSQDEEFDLQIAARDFDLVFTIKDRTASEYSFAERSSGLKYFLSYLVQYLARKAGSESDGLLLMDEPDAYLSSQGQQDLLRLFRDYADHPARESIEASRQVVFVTHSPFLIDKNRADRIRVLDKGNDAEGTRVVRDVGRNHYEPLRSALGAHVGETAFVGNCNIVVEGISDQVFMAGLSSTLGRHGASSLERLDLNEITLVPAGSASHIPYMTFLIRGRDANQPAVVVVLDGDDAGDEAAQALQSGPPRGKQVLDPGFVLRIAKDSLPDIDSDRPDGPLEIEDLVPAPVAARAIAMFAEEVGIGEESRPDAEAIKSYLSPEVGVHKASQKALADVGSSLRLDKLGFARHVVATLDATDDRTARRARKNFKTLFLKVGELQRQAVAERSQREVGDQVDRTIDAFLSDHQSHALRSDVRLVLERIEGMLDSTFVSEEIRKRIRLMRHDMDLDSSLADPVDALEDARQELEAMKYAGILASQEGTNG